MTHLLCAPSARRSMFAALGLGLWLALSSPPASAQVCTVLGSPPAFGTYSAGNGSPANGSITVTCVLGLGPVPYTIKLGMSAQAQGTQRRMSNGAAYLNYNVFCDSGYSQVWGDGLSTTCTRTGTQTSALALPPFPVYGFIPPGQYVTPGTYGDNIAIEVLY